MKAENKSEVSGIEVICWNKMGICQYRSSENNCLKEVLRLQTNVQDFTRTCSEGDPEDRREEKRRREDR